MKQYKKSGVRTVKVTLFFAVLAVMAVIGLMWFLRPTVSEQEKRELTKFPQLTLAGFWDGTWFSGIDTWYADTYPLRESMVNGSGAIKSLYGIQTRQIVGQEQQGEEIPTDPQQGEATLPATPDEPDEPNTPADDPQEDGHITQAGELIEGVYISGNSGYGLYYFVQNNVDWYAAIINEAYKRIDANIYCMIAPINSGVLFSDDLQKQLHVSDQREAIRYAYSRMNENIHTVDVFGALREHQDEYIFFRTDHHWTGLGAYYAYTAFAGAKGITPHTLDQFELREYPGLLGTYYNNTQSAALAATPDTVQAWVPMATNTMHMTMTDGNTYEWRIINDVSSYGKGIKYGAFTGGDNPISWVENQNLSDGSACLVIKDSYANAFIPYLVDHYQYTYWVDFRYCQNSLPALVKEKGISDVIFLQQIYNTSSKNTLPLLQALVER